MALLDRESVVYRVKLAEQAERFEEMAALTRQLAVAHTALTDDERSLLSVAYKNVVGARRAAWRILSALEQKQQQQRADGSRPSTIHADEPDEDGRRAELVAQYRSQVEAELRVTCGELIALLDDGVLAAAPSHEAAVFLHKMKADYHRYVAEFASGAERREQAESALLAYKAATDVAVAELPPTHPVRLGLALNFSVFYYEILSSPDRACRLAQAAFDGAVSRLERLSEDNYRDSTLIMQLLRDNLTLWTSDLHALSSSPEKQSSPAACSPAVEESATAASAEATVQG